MEDELDLVFERLQFMDTQLEHKSTLDNALISIDSSNDILQMSTSMDSVNSLKLTPISPNNNNTTLSKETRDDLENETFTSSRQPIFDQDSVDESISSADELVGRFELQAPTS
ncbi:hypothetical protein HK096_006372, partial [Nowakowskiella sp. JEL0078]